MLAAILQNLQNGPQPSPPQPTVIKIDRGGGGQSWPGYDIVDIYGALQAFREIPGEHPVARAARRHRHVGEHLGRVKELHERREGAAFLTGAALADAAARERYEAMQRVDLATLIAIIDDVRGKPTTALQPAPLAGRGGSGTGGGGVIVGLVLGLVAFLALGRRR